ncbi:MAG TPA: pectinesterase family protein [Actinospica sp.]|jgi:pectin methylesterase-like acyl-CoA thioesterase|nr:pectinesterase family protein [Actinospica sp.]
MNLRRTLLLAAGTSAALIAGTLTASAATPAASVTLTVAKSGAEYTTVQAAVNAVPDDSSTSYTISIAKGTYSEMVNIPATKLHLSLIGATGNPADVVITSSTYAGETNTSTGSTYGTEGSATVHVKASNFTAKYVTFSNTFDKLNYPSVTATQAVAIAMEGDRQVYEDDVFYGHQDTLLSWDSTASAQLRQYVYDSTVEGDVDFIFGNGDLVVDRSNIQTVNDGIYSNAYLTAPATYSEDTYGILLTGDTVTSSLASNTVYLGRAWKPYTDSVPQLVVRNTNLPAQVNSTNPYLGISGATWTSGRYYEYDNSGYGANASESTRPQLTSSNQGLYTAYEYLSGSDGWDPVVSGAATSVTAASIAEFRNSQVGDTRDVARPTIPATCQTVDSTLADPASREFTDDQEAAAPDTARIQAALTACAGTGQAVVLAPSSDGTDTAFLSAPLSIGKLEYLVLDPTVTLYASRQAADYGTAGSYVPFISVSGNASGIESIRSWGRDRYGNPIQGVIDGRGDLPLVGTTTSWWDLAAAEKTQGITSQAPRLIQATKSDDFTVYDVTLRNTPKQNIYYKEGGGLLIDGLVVETPDTALNTDGVDFDSSAYGTIRDSWLMDGDDCVAMEANDGTVAHLTVEHDQCFGTHGISVGSGTTNGVEAILVDHNLIDGKDRDGTESGIAAGIRIKSYAGAGGLVQDVVYRDTTMSDLANPIDIDPFYAAATGTSAPDFAGILIDGATATNSLPGAQEIVKGYDAADPTVLTLRDVHVDATATVAQYAQITERQTNLVFTGTGVTVAPID